MAAKSSAGRCGCDRLRAERLLAQPRRFRVAPGVPVQVEPQFRCRVLRVLRQVSAPGPAIMCVAGIERGRQACNWRCAATAPGGPAAPPRAAPARQHDADDESERQNAAHRQDVYQDAGRRDDGTTGTSVRTETTGARELGLRHPSSPVVPVVTCRYRKCLTSASTSPWTVYVSATTVAWMPSVFGGGGGDGADGGDDGGARADPPPVRRR